MSIEPDSDEASGAAAAERTREALEAASEGEGHGSRLTVHLSVEADAP